MKKLKVNKWLLVSVVLALLLVASIIFKKQPEKVLIPGKTEVRWLDDSTKYYQQDIAIASSLKEIKRLQDSLEKALSKDAKTKPTTIVRVTEHINYDSLYAAYTTPLKDSISKYMNLADSAFKKQVLAKYRYKDQWLYQEGRVLGGGISIDSLVVTSKYHFMISETKGLFKPKKLVVQVINENPKVSYTDLESYTYTQKKRPFSLVLGPTVSYNGNIHAGIGLTFGLKLY